MVKSPGYEPGGMRRRLLSYLVCPECHRPLDLRSPVEAEDGHVMAGELHCRACGAVHPIVEGVPRLTPHPVEAVTARTVSRFGDAWSEFDRLDDHYEDQFLGWISPNRPESFRDEVVLEAGCGKGRHSSIMADWGARDVIATDLGSAVDVAFRNTRARENVHVVQADLHHLPVRPESVDAAFSVGVLHHVIDPEAAFRAVASCIRPGGRMIAWVYGRENNGWIIYGVNPVREALTSRLPSRAVYQLSRAPAAALWAVTRAMKPLRRKALRPVRQRIFYHAYLDQLGDFPFWEIHSIVHDHLTPPIAHYIPGHEFERWFREASLVQVTIGWHNENSWRGTGVVAPRRGD